MHWQHPLWLSTIDPLYLAIAWLSVSVSCIICKNVITAAYSLYAVCVVKLEQEITFFFVCHFCKSSLVQRPPRRCVNRREETMAKYDNLHLEIWKRTIKGKIFIRLPNQRYSDIYRTRNPTLSEAKWRMPILPRVNISFITAIIRVMSIQNSPEHSPTEIDSFIRGI